MVLVFLLHPSIILKSFKVETWPVNVCFSSGIQYFLVGRCCILMFQTIDSKHTANPLLENIRMCYKILFPCFKNVQL